MTGFLPTNFISDFGHKLIVFSKRQGFTNPNLAGSLHCYVEDYVSRRWARLADVEKSIADTEASLKELKDKKAEICDKIKMNRLSELDALISKNGLSFDEVKELLSSKEA